MQQQQQHDWNGFASPSTSAATLLSALSPGLQRAVQMELEGKAAPRQHYMQPSPNPYQMQASPAPPLFQERLFASELGTTNTPVSSLKRPVESHATTTTTPTNADEGQFSEPPSKKMKCSFQTNKGAFSSDDETMGPRHSDENGGPARRQYEEDSSGDVDNSNLAGNGSDGEADETTGDGEGTDFLDLSKLEQFFPLAPRTNSKLDDFDDQKLEDQLEPVTCPQKRDAIAKFLSTKRSKEFSTKLEYDLRVRECRTLGRMLTGSWHGYSAGGGDKWFYHPVYNFRMWLRVSANGSESLFTCRDGKWKRNVYEDLFYVPAFGIYMRLWDNKKFLQDHTGTMGDPRTVKKAFKPIVYSMVSVGRGQAQFNKCFDKFWTDPRRIALKQKYSNEMKKKRGIEQKRDVRAAEHDPQQQQQQRQQPAVHLASGAIASGAIASHAVLNIANTINIHYHHPHDVPEADRAPAPPPSGQSGPHSAA